MAFAKKHLDFSFQLAEGNFQGGGNKAEVKNHRASVQIDNMGAPDQGRAEIAIWGMPLSLMNQLTTLGNEINAVGKNFITISAYEEGQGPAIAFKGTIMVAFADLGSQPQGCFRVSALVGYYEQMMKAEPTSAPGSQDVAQLFKQIAGKAGLSFEDGGVKAKIMNPYLWSSPRIQMKELGKMAGVNWDIDRGTLSIWPQSQARPGAPVEISSETGMVNYPRFTQSGIEVVTLFNPNYKFGGTVKVKSELTPASGSWYIYHLGHEIDADIPNGKWFSTLSCSRTQV